MKKARANHIAIGTFESTAIYVGNRRILLRELQPNGRMNNQLKRWHIDKTKDFACCCKSNASQKLDPYKRNGIVRLRCAKNTKHLHDPTCYLYQSLDLFNQNIQYVKCAVSRCEETGILSIRGTNSLNKNKRSMTSSENVNRGTSKRPQYSKVTLLGLLQTLWDAAKLNHWFHERKDYCSWDHIAAQLMDTVKTTKYNGVALDNRLFVGTPNEHVEGNSGGLEHGFNKKSDSCFVIGDVEKLDVSKNGHERIKLGGCNWIYMDDEIKVGIEKSYKGAIKAIPKQERCIAIIQVKMSKNGFWSAKDLALMPTTSHGIPYDSSYELRLAEVFIKNKYAFEKPQKIKDNESFVPDFVVHKDGIQYVVEVWGLDTAEYNAHRDLKTEHYLAKGYKLYEWDPVIHPNKVRLVKARTSVRLSA